MQATLKLSDDLKEINLPDVSILQFTRAIDKPSSDGYSMTKQPTNPLTLITSNIPEELVQQFDKILSDYCSQ